MSRLDHGWNIQRRVIGALLIRELSTRFGRENIGFLWVMAEPLLFATLVGVMWRLIRGPSEHGINIVAFVATGYIPLTTFRNAVNRSVGLFTANSSLMYHRQIKITDFIFVRVLIEMIGGMMAYLAMGVLLYALGMMPIPTDFGLLISGWALYCFFTLAVCSILAPLSEMSDVLEKFMGVTTYIMIPFSGTFNLVSALTPKLRDIMYWSPPVNAMEMMRYGVFGDAMHPYYDPWVPLWASLGCLIVGLILCRRIRRKLVVE